VTEVPPDIVIDHDVEVPTRDGTILRANVFRPPGQIGRPVVLSAHPYGKDQLPTRRHGRWTFSPQYRVLRQAAPVRFSALTSWEAPDPAWWVAQGFVVVNVDLRGCGTSDGIGRLLSEQEAEDTYDIIEWAARQPWSDGRVVMAGVSYLAITQYAAAALQPPSLKAIVPWEGFTDAYRDLVFPGGVREKGFTALWTRLVQRSTRQSYNMIDASDRHPMRDAFWQSLVPDLSSITVPMLVCGSFSDHNLHTRGSFRAFQQTGSRIAQLYTHRGGKWATFYSAEARARQLSFIRTALDSSGTEQPSRTVRLEVREDRDTITAVREETQWPLARTEWRRLYPADDAGLTPEQSTSSGRISFKTHSHAATFTCGFPKDVELTGPMMARLWVELDGPDANLFVTVEKWRDGRFVPFEGSYGYGLDTVTHGWQRIALRALDSELSTPYEPVPSCTAPQPLRKGEIAPVDVALLPSATLFRAGEQLRLVVAGRWPAPRNPLTGGFPAAYPRPPRRRITIHWGPSHDTHLLVPVIPG
jgi:putative CocE/NonD family hydrolase